MLNKLKEHVYKLMYNYYHNKANYCFGKVDAYGPEYNDYWGLKTAKYTLKEFEVADKLIALQEVDY